MNERNYMPRGFEPDYIPPRDAIERRKEKFAAYLHLSRNKNAWLISTPGDPLIRFECLPGSDFPNELRDLGIRLTEEPDGERILATAIVENFIRADTGELIATAGSTRPIALTVRHAGIAPVRRYSFTIS